MIAVPEEFSFFIPDGFDAQCVETEGEVVFFERTSIEFLFAAVEVDAALFFAIETDVC